MQNEYDETVERAIEDLSSMAGKKICVVEDGAVVTRALVADGIKIRKNAVVGSADSENIELVAKRVKGEE